jgi:signal transduction histidine kinase
MMIRWWNRLSFRIPGFILLVTLTPLLAFGIIVTRMSAQTLTQEVGRANRMAAIRAVELIEATVSDAQEDMTIAVNSPEFSGMEYETQKLALQSLLRLLHDVKSLTVIDEQGYEQVKLSREKVFLADDLNNRADDAAYERAIQGHAYIGPIRTTAEGNPTVTLAVPIWNLARDKTAGVLVADISLRSLLSAVVSLQVGKTGSVFIVDSSGTVIAHPDYSLVLAGEDFSDHSHIQHFLIGEPTDEAHIHINHDGIDVLSVGASSPDLGWIVIVEQPVAEALAVTQTMAKGLTYILGITLLLSAAIVGYAVVHLTRPLQNLAVGAGLIGRGVLDHRIEVKTKDEIGKLAAAFNEMAANLQAYTARLEQSNRDLEEFVYIATHDLQEPLRKILAFGDRLVAKYEAAFDDVGRDYLNRMHNATRRLQTLIDDLLVYSRVSTQVKPWARINLTDVAQAVVSDLESQLRQTKGRVEFGTLPVIEADPDQIYQLLKHLIVNALKFRQEGLPPVVKLRGSLVGQDGILSHETCQIIVEDNGIGFEQQFAERIFKPFQRLHRRGEYGGSGMGLAICRRIVERHGGYITAESRPGEGATFLVTLPVRQANSEQ